MFRRGASSHTYIIWLKGEGKNMTSGWGQVVTQIRHVAVSLYALTRPGASPRIFEWGGGVGYEILVGGERLDERVKHRQGANLPPKYPKNRKRHRIWAILSSNLEGTSPPLLNLSLWGTRSLRPPSRFRRPLTRRTHWHQSRIYMSIISFWPQVIGKLFVTSDDLRWSLEGQCWKISLRVSINALCHAILFK